MPAVFISYSRRDKEFVRQLGASLVARKRDAWVDWKDIPLTAEWQREIFANIEAADDFVFIISSDSVISTNCKREIDHAAANNKRMLPIFYRNVADEEIPPPLARFQGIDFRETEDFEAKVTLLVDALDTDLPWTQAHTRLLTRALEWERRDKDRSLLLRGRDLREAEAWQSEAGGKTIQPTARQSQFILASRQATTRLQRIVIASIGVAFLITLGLAVYSLWQAHVANQERSVATARQLSAQSQVHLDQNSSGIELAVLLAVEAARRLPSWESEQALRASLRLFPRNIAVLKSSQGMDEWTFDRSERWVLATGSKTGARLWNLTDPAQPWEMPHIKEGFGAAHLSDDAASVMTYSDGDLKLWDRRTHSLVRAIPFTPDQHNFNGVQVMPGWRAALYARPPEVLVMPLQGAPQYHVEHPEPGTDYFAMSLELSPDGEHFVTSEKTKAALWELGLQTPVAVIPSPKRGSDLNILFVDSHLFAIFAGTALELHDSLSGRLMDRFTLPVEPERLLFNPGANIVAITEKEPNDNAVTVYDLRRQKTLGRVVHPDAIGGVKFSADGNRLITSDGIADSIVSKVQINEITDTGLSEVATLVERGAPEFNVTPDADLFLTRSVGPIQVWNGRTGLELARIESEYGTLSPSGRLVLADPGVESPGDASVWDIRTMSGRLEPDISVMDTPEYRRAMRFAQISPGPNLHDAVGPCGTYSCDGQRLVLIVNPGNDRVCTTDYQSTNCSSGAPGARSDGYRLVRGPVEPKGGYGTLDKDEAWTSSTFLLTLGLETPDDSLHIIDRKTKKDFLWIPSGPLYSAGFSATGKYLAGIKGSKVTLWSASTGRELSSYQMNYRISDVTFAADDSELSILTEDIDAKTNPPRSFHVLRISSAGSLSPVLRRDSVRNGDLCTTGQRTVTESGDGKVLRLIDVDRGREIRQVAADSGDSVSAPKELFSPDCSRLATQRENHVTIWDAANGRSLQQLTLGGPLSYWAFTPDRTHLVTTEEATATVWDLSTGLSVARISNEESPGKAGIWGVFFVGQNNQRLHLVLGTTFTTSSLPATVSWRLDELISQACSHLTRNLTRAEWTNYIGSETYRKTCANLP